MDRGCDKGRPRKDWGKNQDWSDGEDEEKDLPDRLERKKQKMPSGSGKDDMLEINMLRADYGPVGGC